MSSKTRTRKLVEWIDRQPGWRVQRSGGGHYRVLAPDGVGMCTIGCSPNTRARSWPNMIARLRKMGLTDIPTF